MSNMLTPAWTPLKYHPQQYALWTSKARFRAVVAGRGSGKSEISRRFLVRHLPVEIKSDPNPLYAYTAPTYSQVRRLGWDKILPLIPPEWIAESNISNMKLTTIYGSTIYCVGLDKPQRIEGSQYAGIVLDESADLKPGTFDRSILPALAWNKGWALRIGVPKRYGSSAKEFKEFYDRAKAGELPDAAAFTWPSSEIIPKDLLEYARATMDVRDFEEQLNASWLDAGGGIFHSFSKEHNVRPCTYHPEKELIIGMDFNVSPFSIIIGHLHGERRHPNSYFEVIDEIFLRDSNTQQALDVLFSRYRQHTGGLSFYGDATSKARKTSAAQTDYVQIAQHAGIKGLGRNIYFPDSNPAVADRFACSNSAICSGDGKRRFFVSPSCKHLIVDLETRVYKEGTRESDTRNKDSGHLTDAAGYVLYALFPMRLEVTEYSVPEVSIF